MTADYLRWLLSDTPSRAWQRASFEATTGNRKPLRWMARALKIDPDEPRAWFALAGFAPMQLDGRWHIGAPWPAPDPFDPDSHPGDDVLLVDPATNQGSILGDTEPAIIAPHPQPEELTVFTDAMGWLRRWADERVIFFEKRRDAVARSRVIPTFTGEPPAALAVGDINKVPWAQLHARVIKADFEHAKVIKRAIFRAADLPRVEAA